MSIVINGGGMIGLILALILSKLTQGSLDISLIEQYSPYSNNVPLFVRMPRVIALSRGAYSELMQINIGSVLSTCSTIINQIEISECSRLGKIFIQAQDYQLSELGYTVELHPIRKRLFNLLREQSAVTMYYPAIIKQIKREKFYNVIFLNTGEQITSKLIIAADGSCSTLASNCGIKWFRWNYQQTAIVTEVMTEIPHSGQAFEKFTIFGPLALLPMSNNLSFLIWCIPNRKQQEVLKWDKNKFSQELQKLFGWKLGKILNVKTRYFYNLWLTYAKNHISHRLALVGNAAQNLHPIAGQGFNLGVRDAITLAKIIYQALYDNIDIGDDSILNVYQKRRRLDQYQTITVTDGLIRLFGSHCLPLIIARNLGLLCVNHSSFLKRLLVNAVLSWKVD